MELAIGFFALLLVLGLVTVVGHGLWLILAALVREITVGSPDNPSADAGLREVATAIRQLRGLRARDELDPETAERVGELLERRRRVLMGEATVPSAPPVPEPEKTAPQADTQKPPVLVAVSASPPAQRPGVSGSPPTLIAPAPRRRPITDVLGAFMEERNILWGELVGGLLVVGCSLALVLTLWRSLEQLPYFPFLLFTALTAALFGAGQYTLHHWKLASTSRGLLIICLLLLPLNLLVLGDLTAPRMEAVRALGWLDPLVTIAALSLLTVLSRAAGRDLIGADVLPGPIDRRWLLALAILGSAAVPLLGARLLPDPGPSAFFLLALLSVLCQAGATSAVLGGLAGYGRHPAPWRLEARQAGALLVFLGLGTFALLAALAFLRWHAADLAMVGPLLAVPLSVAGGPILAAGLQIRRRLSPEGNGGLRTVGAGVALVGPLMMLVGILLTWPHPLTLLIACLLAGAMLAVAGFGFTARAHAGSLPCLALAVLIAFHFVTGRLPVPSDEDPGEWLIRTLTSATSGTVLTALALYLAGVAELLARFQRTTDAVCYALGGAGLMLLGLLTVTWHGIEEPLNAAIVHGVCVFGLLVSNERWQRRSPPTMAGWLVPVGTLWALWFLHPGRLELWGLVLATEALILIVLTLRLRSPAVPRVQLRSACLLAGSVAGVLALGLAVFARDFPEQGVHTFTAFALALSAFGLAGLTGQVALTWIGSLLGLAGLAHLCCYNVPTGTFSLPLVVALASHATLALLAAVALGTRIDSRRLFAIPLRESARLTSLVALPFILFAGPDLASARAMGAFWLAFIWLAVAVLEGEPSWFTGFQAGVSAAVLFAVTAWLKRSDWLGESSLGLLDPRAFQAYLIGLSLLGLVWIGLRKLAARRPLWAALWTAPWPALDRVVLAGLVPGQLVLAVVFLVPDVANELAMEGYPLPFNPPAEFARAHGLAAWLLLGTLAAVLLANLAATADSAPETVRNETGVRDAPVPPRGDTCLGLMALLLTAPVLWAGFHAVDRAAASALRWGLAWGFLLCSALVWVRGPLARLAAFLRLGSFSDRGIADRVRALLLGPVGMVLGLTTLVGWLTFRGLHPAGPLAGSPFALIGPVASDVWPLAVLVAGLAMTGIHERFPAYAFGAGLVAIMATVGGSSLAIVIAGGEIHNAEAIRLALLACLTASVCALGWLACRRVIADWPRVDPLLQVQANAGLVGLVVLAVPPLAALVVSPDERLNSAYDSLGGLGWLVLLLSAAASLWHCRETAPRRMIDVLGATALIAGSLLACLARARDTSGLWLSYHALASFWSLLALALVVGITWLHGRLTNRGTRRWLEALALALFVLAFRSPQDPFAPLPGAGMALVAAILLGALGLWSGGRAYAYFSGGALSLTGVLLWAAWGPPPLQGVLLTIGLCLALASVFWTIIGLIQAGSETDTETPARPGLPFAHQAPLVALGLLLLTAMLDLLLQLSGFGSAPNLLDLAALEIIGLSLVLALWDRKARFALPGLYLLGLAAVGLLLRHPIMAPYLGQAVGVALALHVLLTSLLAWAAERRPGWFRPFALPSRSPEETRDWMVPAQAAMVCIVVVLGAAASVQGPLPFPSRLPAEATVGLRLTGPLAILPLLLACTLLSAVWPGMACSAARHAVLALVGVFLALLAFALPDPSGVAPWLQRSAWLLLALVTATLVCTEGVERCCNGAWRDEGHRVSLWLASLAGLIAIDLLVQQIPVFDPVTKRTPLTAQAVAASLLALVVLAVILLRWATMPERDPLGSPSETPGKARSGYVYAAELLLLCTFLQLRLNVPELFVSELVRYWMLLVMLLALVAIGLGELFERRGPTVLARPLQRTGVFLPLIPLLAFWARPPQVLIKFADAHAPGLRPFLAYLERIPAHLGAHALIWFLASGLYALVALSRRSFYWVLAAALSANFGIWALLGHAGIGFLVHPQVWLIPLALIILVSEHLNRDELSAEVASGLRYFGLSMIYVASTADLYIAGVGNSVWLPVVLAVLAVAGVLVGILLRVKAFLFLGVSFLLTDILTMIWHAAVDCAQTWVWWASGVVLGMAILALFAVFEKRRNDVLRMLEDMRRWA